MGMDFQLMLLFFIPLGLNLSVIYLSFLDWYERELRAVKSTLVFYLLSLLAVLVVFYFGGDYLITIENIYRIIVTTIFFLIFPEIYLFVVWIRKGANKSFIVLSVLSYTAILWLILPHVFWLVGVTGAVTIVTATYFAGVILGTLLPVAIIKEVEVKDGFFTASAATTSLTLSDAVSKNLHGFSIFGNIWVQLAILVGSAILSFYIYRRAVR